LIKRRDFSGTVTATSIEEIGPPDRGATARFGVGSVQRLDGAGEISKSGRRPRPDAETVQQRWEFAAARIALSPFARKLKN
jgi:hypothetical protein